MAYRAIQPRSKGKYDASVAAERQCPENQYTGWMRLAFTIMVMDIAGDCFGFEKIYSFGDAHRFLDEHQDVRRAVYQLLYETVCGDLDEKQMSRQAWCMANSRRITQGGTAWN